MSCGGHLLPQATPPDGGRSVERHGADRYLTLDAMRGLAALAVAIFHFRVDLAPVAYLAVDFFLALSGFVLAKAYATRLAGGGSVARFLEMRVVRLYPLFLAGLALGLIWHLAEVLRGVPGTPSLAALAGSALSNLAMLPSAFTLELYPANTAFWSIGAELLVNFVFAVVLVRLRHGPLLLVAGASAVALVALVRAPHFADGGWVWPRVGLGLVRTLFSFVAGYLIAGQSGGERRVSVGALLLAAVLVPLLLAAPDASYRRGYDLAAILAGFPLLLYLAARVEPPTRWRRWAALLGDISYPLYAIHQPIGSVIRSAGEHLRLPTALVLPIYLVVTVVLAAALGHYWDKPVRRRISARLALRRSARPQVL